MGKVSQRKNHKKKVQNYRNEIAMMKHRETKYKVIEHIKAGADLMKIAKASKLSYDTVLKYAKEIYEKQYNETLNNQ